MLFKIIKIFKVFIAHSPPFLILGEKISHFVK